MTGTHEKKKHYGQPNLLPLEQYSLKLFPQRDVPFFQGGGKHEAVAAEQLNSVLSTGVGVRANPARTSRP
jgi:hypothetical protein